MDTLVDLVIDLDENIKDPLAMGNTAAVREIFKNAEHIIKSGKKVILQHKYAHESTNVVEILTKECEIQDFKNKLNDVQKILGKPLI